MKFVYDFDKLGKRHKLAVAIGSLISGSIIMIMSDVYIMGYSLERALVNLNILAAVSIIFMGVLMVVRALRKKPA